MITKSPCGILLKLIYIMESRRKEPVNCLELLSLINKLQNKNPNIVIYNINKPSNEDSQEELVSFDYWDDLSILESSGRIKVQKSDPSINITITGSLSAELLKIPKDIESEINEIL